MSEYDLHSTVDDRIAFETQTINSDVTKNGEIIDTAGFESIEFILQSVDIPDGTFTALLEEDDDALMPVETTTVLSAEETLGVLTMFISGVDDNTTKRVGSIGKKRYQRLSLVSTGVSGNHIFTGIAILGHPHSSPVPQ